MSLFSYRVTAPLRLATRLRRRKAHAWVSLPRPSVCVGNVALGGRAKTPLVASLVRALQQRGWTPGVLTRGYPVVGRRDPTRIVRRVGEPGASWLTRVRVGALEGPACRLSGVVGEEACWVAAVTGVPVAVHPDRLRGARSLLREAPSVDVLVLDDGLQSPVRCDVDLLLLDPDLDTQGRVALREPVVAVHGALSVRLGQDLFKRAGPLRDLETGQRVQAPERALVLLAGVGDPGSVARTAAEAGVRVARQVRVRDHGHPSARVLSTLEAPMLVTEKDAVGWAYATGRPGFVLELLLDGTESLAEEVVRRLIGR